MGMELLEFFFFSILEKVYIEEVLWDLASPVMPKKKKKKGAYRNSVSEAEPIRGHHFPQ